MIVPFTELDASSRVWIFQADVELNDALATEMKQELFEFLKEWTAHNVALYTSGDIFYNRFIVIMVDERFQNASGCSLDTLNRFISHLEKKYSVALLDRMAVAYQLAGTDKIETVHLHQLGQLAKDGSIDAQTLVFNNLVKSKAEFESSWKTPIADSWHKRFM